MPKKPAPNPETDTGDAITLPVDDGINDPDGIADDEDEDEDDAGEEDEIFEDEDGDGEECIKCAGSGEICPACQCPDGACVCVGEPPALVECPDCEGTGETVIVEEDDDNEDDVEGDDDEDEDPDEDEEE